jgi:hypothetical protein
MILLDVFTIFSRDQSQSLFARMISTPEHSHNANCSHPEEKLPKREILTRKDLESFQTSPAYDLFTSFLNLLNDRYKIA